MERRAYSTLTVKAVDDDQWLIEGIASSPEADRIGDIVEPLGAKFKTPMPLLWQHDSRKPIGEVTFAKPNKNGIPFKARIERASSFTSTVLQERALEAWESLKTGLVRGVSIGFRAIEYSFMDDGGIRFLEWEWLELSLVTIPANAEATITAVKQCDTHRPAASGTGRSLKSPTVVGTNANRASPGGATMKTIAERIVGLETIKGQKQKQMEDIDELTDKEGRTKTAEEREQYAELVTDVEEIGKDIDDLKTRERLFGTAKAVDGNGSEAASKSRSTQVTVVREAKPEPGIQFARMAMALAKAKGNPGVALNLLKSHYPNHPAIPGMKTAYERGDDYGAFIVALAEARTKAAVAAGTTTDATWALPLVQYTQFSGDFIEFLRARTIIGQITDRLRRIPFNVHIRGRTSGGSANWVGQGKPKPVTKFDFNDTYHGFYKVAAISVITDELIRFSDPAAEAQVRDGLAEAVIERIDTDFVDPAKAAVANVSPASITNGVSAVTSTGSVGDGDGVRTDLQALWAAALAANLPLTSAVYITTPAIALALSLMVNALGQREFEGMTINGGTLNGVTVVVSNYVPEGLFILAFTSEIYLSDDGVVTVDASREASIEMLDSSLVQDATAGTGASLVSMYQTNSVALRAERYINWSKRRTTAVAYLTDVDWAGAVS